MKRAMVLAMVVAAGLMGCEKEEVKKKIDPRYDGLLPKTTVDPNIFEPMAKSPTVVATPATIPAATAPATPAATEPAPGTETPPETPEGAPPTN